MIIFFIISSMAVASEDSTIECESVDVSIPAIGGVSTPQKLNVCRLQASKNKLIWGSRSCLENYTAKTAKSCKPLSELIRVRNFEYNGFGTPGFTICTRMGGVAFISRLKWKNQNEEPDFCHFENGDFLEISAMMDVYRTAVK